jgi:catechol 2,3-dioxygenase-like lactoylglutathione lyase family enzyme
MIKESKLVGFTATTDSAEAIAFYRDKLGLHLLEETSFAIVFDSNGTTLRIQKAERVVPAPYTLIGWEVENISQAVAELTARGVEFETYDLIQQDEAGIWNVPDGTKVAWFKDPDGNVLSLSQSA